MRMRVYRAMLIARIRRYVKAHDKNTLARVAGLHHKQLYRCEDPDWSPRIETLMTLEDALDRVAPDSSSKPKRAASPPTPPEAPRAKAAG